MNNYNFIKVKNINYKIYYKKNLYLKLSNKEFYFKISLNN